MQNVVSKVNRRVCSTETNWKIGQRPHTKEPSSRREGELKQSAKNTGPDPGNQFWRKPVWTLGPRCGVLGNPWTKSRENIRALDGKNYNSGLMAYFCKGIHTLV